MREELEKLENKIKRIKIKKIPTTFLSIINKEFDETTISKCVAFLLNPKYTTPKIIEQLLIVSQEDNEEFDFLQLFNDNDTKFEDIDIEEQISKRSRTDIIIKFSTFWIIIENKINSYENNEQSLKYEEDLKELTNLPKKFICLKPQYNQCNMKNKNFCNVSYNQLVDILKTITKYDIKEKDNYTFIEDFINHMEGYLMNDNELQINEDLEFYIDNRNIIDNVLKNYQKQCELVKNKLNETIQEKFGEKYKTYSKNGYLQIWKDGWNNEDHSGIHYEIGYEFNHIIDYNVKVQFHIHNESKTKKKYNKIEHKTIKENTYNFNNSKNIINSINAIANEMYNIAMEYNEKIDKIFGT